MRPIDRVFVEAPARLHFGVLDLEGGLGRWFGGVGAAAPAPSLLVSAAAAERLQVEGTDAGRAATFARRFLSHHGLQSGGHLMVHRALPSHAGLGSGTQLALAVARALAEIHGIDADVSGLAQAVGRGRRSAIGTWTFAGAGLVVEGGRRPEGDTVAPLLARLPFPAAWRCVVAVPARGSGVSGSAEAEAFARMPTPPAGEVERVSHLVLMGLLPAAAEADLQGFGEALQAIQQATGHWFASVQGGVYASGPSEGLVRVMRELHVPGVGQSSWGPTVYGIVSGTDESLRLRCRVREALDEMHVGGAVYEGPMQSPGARVWRQSAAAADVLGAYGQGGRRLGARVGEPV